MLFSRLFSWIFTTISIKFLKEQQHNGGHLKMFVTKSELKLHPDPCHPMAAGLTPLTQNCDVSNNDLRIHMIWNFKFSCEHKVLRENRIGVENLLRNISYNDKDES